MGQPIRQSRPTYSVERYLAIERASVERHEYLDGEIIRMAGESGEHGDISANLVGIIVPQLKGTPCRARFKDTKVLSGSPLRSEHVKRVLFSYPDVIVICGEPLYYDEHRDIVLNPTALVEVLSPPTERFDRGEKFQRFQTWNESLKDYVLVSQDKPLVEHFSRQADGSWSYRSYVGLQAEFDVESIRCNFKLADIYDRVKFEEQVPPATR